MYKFFWDFCHTTTMVYHCTSLFRLPESSLLSSSVPLYLLYVLQHIHTWMQGYLPAQLYDLTSRYGTKEELQSLTWTLNHAGIRPIADVVINHRCGDIQSETGVWNLFGYVYTDSSCIQYVHTQSSECSTMTSHSYTSLTLRATHLQHGLPFAKSSHAESS